MRSKSVKFVSQIFIALIAVSFSAWGMSGVFINGGNNVLANVGQKKILTDDFQRQVQSMIVAQKQATGVSMSPEEAREAGIFTQALDILIQRAVLDAEIADLGLYIDAKTVLEHIRGLPQFQDKNGDFDRNIYARLLAGNYLSEGRYIDIERGNMLRRWLLSAIENDSLPVPDILTGALYVHFYEQRSLRAVILPPAPIDSIPLPETAVLRAFYEENQEDYITPKLANISLIIFRPEDKAKEVTIGEQEIRDYYDRSRDTWGTPEARDVMRLSFDSLIDAQTARENMQSGEDFIAFAKARHDNSADYDLGSQSRADIGDEKLSDVVFSLNEGEVSAPVESDLGGIFLVYVRKVTPEDIQPYESVRGDIDNALRLDAAHNEISVLFDRVEDLRLEGETLGEIAPKIGYSTIEIKGVSIDGRDKEGMKIASLNNTGSLLQRIFNSEASLDEETLELSDGTFIWYEINNFIDPSLRPFDEVEDKVGDAWRKKQLLDAGEKRAVSLIEEAKRDGLSLDDIAERIGVSVEEYGPNRRSVPFGTIDMGEEERIFSASQDEIVLLKAHELFTDVRFADGSVDDEARRKTWALGQTSAIIPDRQEQKEIVDLQLRNFMLSEIVTDYIMDLRKKHAVSINRSLLSTFLEGETDAY